MKLKYISTVLFVLLSISCMHVQAQVSSIDTLTNESYIIPDWQNKINQTIDSLNAIKGDWWTYSGAVSVWNQNGNTVYVSDSTHIKFWQNGDAGSLFVSGIIGVGVPFPASQLHVDNGITADTVTATITNPGVVVYDSVVTIIDSANGTVGQMQLLEVHEPSFRTNGLSFGYRKYWVKLGALSTGSTFLKIWTDSANGVYMTKVSFDGANVRLDSDTYIDPVYNDFYFHSTRWQVNSAWNGTVPVSNNTALVATGSTTKHFRVGYSYYWKQQLVGIVTIHYAMTGTASSTPFVFWASRFAI